MQRLLAFAVHFELFAKLTDACLLLFGAIRKGKFEMSIKTNGEEWKLSCFVRVLCNPYDELTTNHEVNPTLFLIFKQPQARRYENAIDNRPAQNPQIYNQGLNPAFA